MKNKLISVLLILCIISLTLASCSRATVTGENSNTSIFPNAQEIGTADDAADVWDGYGIIEKIGEQYYVYDAEKDTYYLQSINSRKLTKITYSDKTDKWIVGSGSALVEQNRYYYRWLTVEDSEPEAVRLVMLDGKTGKESIVDTAVQASPFIYLCKIDEERFLSFTQTGVFNENDKEKKSPDCFVSCATLYTVNGDKKEIIRETYQNTDEKNSSGIALDFFAYDGGKLFATAHNLTDGNYKHYLNSYSLDGELIEQRELKGLDELIGREGLIDFSVKGEYLAFTTFESMNNYICKIGENGVEIIMKSDRSHNAYSAFGNTFVMSKKDTAASEKGKNTLFFLNTKTGKTKAATVSTEFDLPCLNECKVLSDGSMLLTYTETYDSGKAKQYIIDQSFLDRLQ